MMRKGKLFLRDNTLNENIEGSVKGQLWMKNCEEGNILYNEKKQSKLENILQAFLN